jgi:biotin synthase
MENVTCISDGPVERVVDILDRALGGARLSRRDIRALLSEEETSDISRILSAADCVRKAAVGDDVLLRGIIDFSNVCGRQCLYCGIRGPNRLVRRYRMTPGEIVRCAEEIKSAGVSTVILQSGEDPSVGREWLCGIIREIREDTGLVITLSVGERSREDYRAFRDAGARRYLLKHETAAPSLYRSLHPDMRLKDRLACLRWIRDLGYEVGSGNMIGLPGQGAGQIAADIAFVRRLGADMIGIGPFIPHPDTPLAGYAAGDIDSVVRCVAVTRLVVPSANIPATTALRTIDPHGTERALTSGANVVMIDFTPESYRGQYSIYPGRITREGDPRSAVEGIREISESLGRGVG